jgi:Fe-S protein assembly co-chaperone HscB
MKQPLERAKHLLALNSITVGSEADSVKPSNALLMEIMEQREALSEAGTVEAIIRLEAANTQVKQETMEKLSAAFKASDFARAAELTIKLGYLLKMEEEIRVRKKGLAA